MIEGFVLYFLSPLSLALWLAVAALVLRLLRKPRAAGETGFKRL